MNRECVLLRDPVSEQVHTPRALLALLLDFVGAHLELVESLLGFPEQISERIFRSAERRDAFQDPRCSVTCLQVFTRAHGELVLKSLCLRDRSLLLLERVEEIRLFRSLETLDLHGCRLGDEHEFFGHLTSDACSRLVRLFLGENGISDRGLQRLTTPVRVMRRGLENLQLLDLSGNPLTEKGLGYLTCLQKLRELNITGTRVQLGVSLETFFRRKMMMVLSASPRETFSHSSCRTEGWAAQVIDRWELRAAEAPPKIQTPKSNALRFYGRERFVKENVHAVPNHHATREKTTVHFYRPEHHASPRRQEQGPSTSTKRKLLEDQGPPTKRPSAPSAQDLELLNSY